MGDMILMQALCGETPLCLHSTCCVHTEALASFILLQSPSLHFSLAHILSCAVKLELFSCSELDLQCLEESHLCSHTHHCPACSQARASQSWLPSHSSASMVLLPLRMSSRLEGHYRQTPRLGWNCPLHLSVALPGVWHCHSFFLVTTVS